MNITLINPPSGPVYSKFKRSPIKRLPLGLAYIAAFLEKSGHNVSTVDADTVDLNVDDAAAMALGQSPDIIGITATTPLIKGATEIIRKIKENNPAIYTILGGPHGSSVPKETMSTYRDIFDFLIFGEGEYSAMDVVKAIESGDPFKSPIPGAVFSGQGNEIVMGSPRQREKDLDNFPFPARHLFPIEKYVDHTKAAFGENAYAMITTTRGCPFDCIFCGSKSTWGRRTLYRTPQNVVDEICECVEKFGIKNIMFCDDTFTLKKDHTIETCRLISELPYDITLYVSSRADTLDDERLEWLKKAGCYCIGFGFESGNDEILEIMRKEETVDHALKAAALTKSYGIEIHGSFIIGNAGDTEETIEQTIQFAIDMDVDLVQFPILVPLPATPSYDMAMEQNAFRCAPDNYEEFYWYYSVSANLTKGVPDKRLIELQKQAYERWNKSREEKNATSAS